MFHVKHMFAKQVFAELAGHAYGAGHPALSQAGADVSRETCVRDMTIGRRVGFEQFVRRRLL